MKNTTTMERLSRALGHEGMDRCSAPDAQAAWGELTQSERLQIFPILSDRERGLIGMTVKVGDKVKVHFESGNRLVGRIIQVGDQPVAEFGRGENKFTSKIQWASWGGKSSWKEQAI